MFELLIVLECRSQSMKLGVVESHTKQNANVVRRILELFFMCHDRQLLDEINLVLSSLILSVALSQKGERGSISNSILT